MGFKSAAIICLVLFAASGHGLDFSPWLPPLWEFQSEQDILYVSQDKEDTKQDRISNPGTIFSTRSFLALTFWPDWEIETAFYFSRASDISYTYETAYVHIKHQLYDDCLNDPFALATGILFNFPNTHFLRSPRFLYHGEFNVEAYASLGKEWSYGNNWIFHLWGFAALGIANRGVPWIHTLFHCDWNFDPFIFNLFTEGMFGLGPHALNMQRLFSGYGSINYSIIDIGAHIKYHPNYYHALALKGWYNIYARNFFVHYWGLEFSILIPFGL